MPAKLTKLPAADDRERRRQQLHAKPDVSPAELRQLYLDAQRAMEDLVLALPPLDPMARSFLTIAETLGWRANRVGRR